MDDINMQTEASDLIQNFGLPRAAQYNYGNISSDKSLQDMEMDSNLVI